jgi:hypothetical protein
MLGWLLRSKVKSPALSHTPREGRGTRFECGLQGAKEARLPSFESALFFELGRVDFGGEVGDIKDLPNFGFAVAGHF